ncbi:hypothetical protein BU16DRAFT_310587 [Lophium mytilinum]|uniref:Uncharacterized protein n=1 Tax=Lophium mytilinum TaxID=390894 RepID=A0A6A6R2P8_9PEZI|nr:hypothetical protein BU16DRAFT_310587 [Lophium mytilinum]
MITLTCSRTSTSTLTTTWFEEDHCDAAPVKRDGLFRRNKNPLPKDCSCYLTTSKSCNSQPTTIYKTVTKLPATTTKSVTIIATVNKVITQSTIQRSTTLIQETTLIDATTIVPVSTLSSTTETSTETATSTATEVTTVTESASATATAYVDRCAPGNIEQLSGIPSFLNGVVVQLGMTSDYQGDYYCCQDCFNNADCVYWAKSSQACYGYYTSRTGPEDDCKVAGQCTRGVQQWEDTTNQGGMTYYKGKCMREAPGPA